jgi:hypothetical protein
MRARAGGRSKETEYFLDMIQGLSQLALRRLTPGQYTPASPCARLLEIAWCSGRMIHYVDMIQSYIKATDGWKYDTKVRFAASRHLTFPMHIPKV